MISFLRRYRQGLILSMAIVFLIGIFVGLGGYFFTGADRSEAVAVIGREKIPYMAFRARVNNVLDRMRSQGEVSEVQASEVKQSILRDMIVDELLAEAAEDMGIKVSDEELSLVIRSAPQFQRDGRFDQQLYFAVVRNGMKSSPERFEADQRRAMLSMRLKQVLVGAAKVSPRELLAEYRAANKGSDAGFAGARGKFLAQVRQQRAVDAVNSLLKELSSKKDVRSFLDSREKGA